MRILLSNDDGFFAPGLKVLYEALSHIAEVTVVAPDRNCSGASNSLTLANPLRARQLDNGFYSVNGTPSDCVHLALNHLLDHSPDLVVAGINFGSNMGDDVIYSGTVAAATEGRYMGLPAVAVSLTGKKGKHYETAAHVAQKVIAQLTAHPLPADQILNINVPDIPMTELQGIQSTCLGRRHQSDTMSVQADPWGSPIYWYGPVGEQRSNGVGTDFYAITHGYASITPLTVDMTAKASIPELNQWLNEVEL